MNFDLKNGVVNLPDVPSDFLRLTLSNFNKISGTYFSKFSEAYLRLEYYYPGITNKDFWNSPLYYSLLISNFKSFIEKDKRVFIVSGFSLSKLCAVSFLEHGDVNRFLSNFGFDVDSYLNEDELNNYYEARTEGFFIPLKIKEMKTTNLDFLNLQEIKDYINKTIFDLCSSLQSVYL